MQKRKGLTKSILNIMNSIGMSYLKDEYAFTKGNTLAIDHDFYTCIKNMFCDALEDNITTHTYVFPQINHKKSIWTLSKARLGIELKMFIPDYMMIDIKDMCIKNNHLQFDMMLKPDYDDYTDCFCNNYKLNEQIMYMTELEEKDYQIDDIFINRGILIIDTNVCLSIHGKLVNEGIMINLGKIDVYGEKKDNTDGINKMDGNFINSKIMYNQGIIMIHEEPEGIDGHLVNNKIFCNFDSGMIDIKGDFSAIKHSYFKNTGYVLISGHMRISGILHNINTGTICGDNITNYGEIYNRAKLCIDTMINNSTVINHKGGNLFFKNMDNYLVMKNFSHDETTIKEISNYGMLKNYGSLTLHKVFTHGTIINYYESMIDSNALINIGTIKNYGEYYVEHNNNINERINELDVFGLNVDMNNEYKYVDGLIFSPGTIDNYGDMTNANNIVCDVMLNNLFLHNTGKIVSSKHNLH